MNNSGHVPSQLAIKLLAWYDRHHRDLAWRTTPDQIAVGIRPDPYRVWLSEIMLQQTTVAAVKSYFTTFIERWPDVKALADADEDDVLKAWAGLGYYSRARNLHKAARQVAHDADGEFPQSFEQLIKLQGVGRYTAAAIASIAFNKPEPVVDGNVERVFTRLFAIETPVQSAKSAIYARVKSALSQTRPGDFAQACMDLGATICTPRKPKCILCPIQDDCAGFALVNVERFPVKLPKVQKPVRFGAAFVAINSDGAILLNKRSNKGLLAGMSGVPTSGWDSKQDGIRDVSAAPFAAQWLPCGSIRHVFTHFHLELFVFKTDFSVCPHQVPFAADALPGHWWSPHDTIATEALPTVIKKVIAAALWSASA